MSALNQRVFWAGVAAIAVASSAPVTRAAEPDPTGLLIVDCLLPGKVQRLGTQATYVTARKAIKTAASECAIRGGEYTAADRATVASSLKVWLPLAKGGDIEAQTNLGEIFEKGMGAAPQPDLAVQWYQLAADQGSARAQINLGALYERGLGVPRDPVKAAELYRKASGLGAAQAPFVPVEEAGALRAERDQLAADLATERAARGRLEGELKALQDRLARETSAVDKGQADLAAARAELSQRTAELAERERASAPTAELAAMRQALDAQRGIVAARDAELQSARAAVARLESQSTSLGRRLEEERARRTAEVAAAEAEAQAARAQRDATAARLAQIEADRAQGANRARLEAAEVERLRRELSAAQGQASQARTDLEARLKAREGELTESRRKLALLDDEVARLKAAAVRMPVARGVEAMLDGVPASDFKFGRFHALVIGNNAYKHIQALETAVTDAKAVDEVLRTRYGFQTTLLLNADRYQVLSALNKLRATLTDQDNLLIYYAGHGELDRVNDRGYWLPVDAEIDSSANWISSIQITDVLNAMTAKQILLVADSCYSGVLTRASIARLDPGMSGEERVRWLQAMATKKARVVLTSGGVQPVLDGGGGDHSVFAAAFLAALRGNSGILESQRLAQKVTQQVAVSAAGASIDQIPVYAPIRFAGHEAGDFFFVARQGAPAGSGVH
ncbi:caspase family protein [Phenylobacterium sp.]|uniref:caspase family protein n=1 Tax=Phenylobacterium sp. TaxID=1871053 RepID=UPI0037C91A88